MEWYFLFVPLFSTKSQWLVSTWGCAVVVTDAMWRHAGGLLRDQRLAWLGWEEQKNREKKNYMLDCGFKLQSDSPHLLFCGRCCRKTPYFISIASWKIWMQNEVVLQWMYKICFIIFAQKQFFSSKFFALTTPNGGSGVVICCQFSSSFPPN